MYIIYSVTTYLKTIENTEPVSGRQVMACRIHPPIQFVEKINNVTFSRQVLQHSMLNDINVT